MSPKSSQRTVVVTAGPTREAIDPVRYLSNDSSGKMGFAIARAAAGAGHRVTLIAGPVALETPARVRRVDVLSARDMLVATREAFRSADALFMAAAVADWRPKRKRAEKWRKSRHESELATLELVRNPDILASLARRKGPRLVVGFALETGAGIARAMRKLKDKGADYIVLNGPEALTRDRASVTILDRFGASTVMQNRPKSQIARALVGLMKEAD